MAMDVMGLIMGKLMRLSTNNRYHSRWPRVYSKPLLLLLHIAFLCRLMFCLRKVSGKVIVLAIPFRIKLSIATEDNLLLAGNQQTLVRL